MSDPSTRSAKPFWNRLIQPAAAIREVDQRRQAALLSAFLLVLIVLAVVVEAATIALIDWSVPYTGYRQTVVMVGLLMIVYVVSRSRHFRVAAALTVAISSLFVFLSGLAQPEGILGGFLDFLILPLWFASLYLGAWELIGLLSLELAGLLVKCPWLALQISLNFSLIGPFSFVVVMAAVLLLLAHQRDLLERDRQTELAEKELQYRTLVEQIPAITYLRAASPDSPTGFASRYLSPQFEAWLGYSIADQARHPGLWRDIVHPDDRERRAAAEAQLTVADGLAAQEYRLVARDQRVLWVYDTVRVRWDAAGRRRLSQGVMLDITARKQAEERTRHEAARAQALLRVAGRLNALLDMATLLAVISEETAQALEAPVAYVNLYESRPDRLCLAAGVGLTDEQRSQAPPVSRAWHAQALREWGPVVVMSDGPARPPLPGRDPHGGPDLRTLAFVSLEYENQLIGSLNVITRGAGRVFTDDDRLLLRGLADQAALAIINTRLYKDARRRLEQLQALRAIDVAISTNHDLRQTLDVVLEQIMRQLKVDAAVVLLLNGGQLEYAASLGFRTPALQYTRLRPGEGNAGQAAQQREVIHIPDLRIAPRSFVYAPILSQEEFVSYHAAPLITQDQVTGVLEVFHRAEFEPDGEWRAFLEALAGQAAIAIDNTALLANLQQANAELAQSYDATIEGWSRALDLRDHETEGHSQRVMEMTLRLARALGVPAAELVHVRRGALLHDIGRMGIPDRILLKPGPLTDAELASMRLHPVYANEMLAPIAYLRPALAIPYGHHEKWDGSGYPRGLAGEAIPLAARLFAIVDVWDALCSNRPYRQAWPPEQVRAHLRSLAGSHFDPAVVDVFLRLLDDDGAAIRQDPPPAAAGASLLRQI